MTFDGLGPIGQIHVSVTDVDRAIAFYRDVLGIPFPVPGAGAHRELNDRGVAFSDTPHVVHRTEEAELWMAAFKDPDGNNLVLMAERPVQ